MEDKPLLNNSETKKPIILYIIIGVLAIVVIVLAILLGTKKCNCENTCPKDDPHYDTKHFVERKGNVFSDRIEGSAILQGTLNHFDSPYFKMLDIYNMKSNENRTILTNFKTYQQTSEVTGHCAAIVMALSYYGDTEITERKCIMDLGMPNPDNWTEDDEEYIKYTDIESISAEIRKFGYETTSNENFTEENFPYKDECEFSEWAQDILKKNETIIVNWADWGGTASIIVGIDNMGNSENCLDHVIILGDTYDTSDHLNDGFYVIGLDKFYYNWQSNEISYLENSTGTFVVIHRKKGN